MQPAIFILDFGSQYTQLIARRVRELNVYCEIVPYNKLPVLTDDVKGIILSGSPFSVKEENALKINLEPILNKLPILGICYGAQYIANELGGAVERSSKREYGKANLTNLKSDAFTKNITDPSQVWMSHGDTVKQLPEGFELLAGTEQIEIAAFKSVPGKFEQPVYAIQFHPEVTHTTQGSQLLSNFVLDVCGCSPDWTPDAFVESTVQKIRQQVGDEKVLLGLSGGVDSTVAAILLHKAIGKNLYCFFIDNGLLRKNEFDEVLASYEGMGLNIQGIRAADQFLSELEGVSDPEQKRKTIGRVFIEVFEQEANKTQGIKWLGQGTIYPDVIESVSVHGPSVTIKSHHNVGGLPERLNLKIIEPLRTLFKDEVRKVGRAMDIPQHILGRHPFPGPGLAIRILGEITREKVNLLQEADYIYINNLKSHNLYDQVWQAGAILLPVQSVGVMGDERTYELTVALRCVDSIDGMTAEWSKLPHEFLATVSSQIINNVKGVNRVVYDISTKPPATIEWE